MTKPDSSPVSRVAEVFGYAIIEDGKIKVRTISDTRRGAIINFLVTDRDTMIFQSMTDEHIERLWFLHRKDAEVDLVTIRLSCDLPPMPKGPAGDRGQVGWMGGEFDR